MLLPHRSYTSYSSPAATIAPSCLHTRTSSNACSCCSHPSQRCRQPISASPHLFAPRSCCVSASSASSSLTTAPLAASSLTAGTQPFTVERPALHRSSISSATSTHTPSSLYGSSSGSVLSVSRASRFEVLVPHARGRGGEGSSDSPRGGGGRGGRGRSREGSGSSPSGRGRGGGRGQGGKEPLSLEACQQGIARGASLPPHRLVYFIWSLASRVNWERNHGESLSYARDGIVADVHESACLLLDIVQGSSVLPVMQLDQQNLSQLSWAVGVLVDFDVRALNSDVRELCYAIAERAVQPGVLDTNLEVACRGISAVLYGLGKAGIKCSDDGSVFDLFKVAVEEQLPRLIFEWHTCNSQSVSNVLLACVYAEYQGNIAPLVSAVASRIGVKSGDVMADALPQNWSNLIWACGKLIDMKGGKGSVLGKGVDVIMREGAAAMERAVSGPMSSRVSAQNLSNFLWGLAHLSWYDDGVVSKLAGAAVEQERVSSSKAQDFSNNLWALSSLGWYDRAVYDDLVRGLVRSQGVHMPQNCSNAIYSCAVASHSGPAVDELACVVSKQDLSGWNGQNISNGLYSWAVLSLLGMASAELDGLACTLFREANGRGTAAFSHPPNMRQLCTAHMEAVRVGLQGGGLSTASGLQQVAAQLYQQGKAERARAKQSGAFEAEQQAMAALQQAGYTVELGARVGGDGYTVGLLVQHESCPGGLAVDIVPKGAFFRHPLGQFSGKVAAVHAQIRQRCGGLVVLSEEEAMQPAVVVGAVQRELARVAGQSSAVPGTSTSSSAAPSPEAVQSPSLLQPKSRPPPSPGPHSAAASPPRRKGRPPKKH